MDADDVVRDLADWWVFDKPKYGTWHLAVPNQGGGTGMRLGIHLDGLETWPREQAEAIANRIRECLNACVGIDTDDLSRITLSPDQTTGAADA